MVANRPRMFPFKWDGSIIFLLWGSATPETRIMTRIIYRCVAYDTLTGERAGVSCYIPELSDTQNCCVYAWPTCATLPRALWESTPPPFLIVAFRLFRALEGTVSLLNVFHCGLPDGCGRGWNAIRPAQLAFSELAAVHRWCGSTLQSVR